MRPRPVLHLISYVLSFIALGEGICWLISLHAGDPASARWALASSSGIVLSIAFLLWALTRGPVSLSRRDGLALSRSDGPQQPSPGPSMRVTGKIS